MDIKFTKRQQESMANDISNMIVNCIGDSDEVWATVTDAVDNGFKNNEKLLTSLVSQTVEEILNDPKVVKKIVADRLVRMFK